MGCCHYSKAYAQQVWGALLLPLLLPPTAQTVVVVPLLLLLLLLLCAATSSSDMHRSTPTRTHAWKACEMGFTLQPCSTCLLGSPPGVPPHPPPTPPTPQVRRNAAALGETLVKRGYTLVTGGTDNHLVLWDLRPEGITGSKMEKACDLCHITLNKNAGTVPRVHAPPTLSPTPLGASARVACSARPHDWRSLCRASASATVVRIQNGCLFKQVPHPAVFLLCPTLRWWAALSATAPGASLLCPSLLALPLHPFHPSRLLPVVLRCSGGRRVGDDARWRAHRRPRHDVPRPQGGG